MSYCSNLQLSTSCGKVVPLINSTVGESSEIYRSFRVPTHVLPRAYGVRSSYKLCCTHIERTLHIATDTVCCCASQMRRKFTSASIKRLPPPFPNLHSSLDRVESPANHQRKCKYGTQQVQLKVKFSFNSFLQNPANRQQDKKQADSSRLIFIIRACSGREQGLVVTGVYSVCRLNLKIAQRSSERFRQ
jgi:hypothetical protein